MDELTTCVERRGYRMTNGNGPQPLPKVQVGKNYFEGRFMKIINELGTFKIKKMESSFLLMPYYKMKLKCRTDRFTYETIVVGDEFDEEEDARENIFQKGFFALLGKYKQDIIEIEKRLRRNNAAKMEETFVQHW